MGTLLHGQSPVQDLLQIKLHQSLQKRPPGYISWDDGHARPECLSQIPYRHF